MRHIRIQVAIVVVLGLLGISGVGRSALAQTNAGPDLTGSWASINHEDALERRDGPFLVDYLGIPFTEEGRELALATSVSRFQTIERQCQMWPPDYIVFGPQGIKVWSTNDPITGALIAYHIGAIEDRTEMAIWMDGRPHPSAGAPHTRAGFWTGGWKGNTLITRTTHVKAGIIRRNGAQHSDQATYTTYFTRHGDRMTITQFIKDPFYLTEPLVISKDFQLNQTNAAQLPIGPPCVAGYEGTPVAVPHYLPGKNESQDDLLNAYAIPREAALGGAETAYPEYRKKLKPVYVRPAKCLRNCFGPGADPTAAPPRGGAGAPGGQRGGDASAPATTPAPSQR